MIILDTYVLSELMRPRPSAVVTQWMNNQAISSLFTTSITEAEIFYGIELLPKGSRRDAFRAAAESMFSQDFSGRILAFGGEAARVFSKIAAHRRQLGRPISHPDAQIAALFTEAEKRYPDEATTMKMRFHRYEPLIAGTVFMLCIVLAFGYWLNASMLTADHYLAALPVDASARQAWIQEKERRTRELPVRKRLEYEKALLWLVGGAAIAIAHIGTNRRLRLA